MLMAVKNQIRISFMSIKYAIMKEMLNRTSFISNVVFMILNNASFIIQWLVLFSLKDNFGNYTLKDVLLLWGMAAGTYGISRIFFKNAFKLSDLITNGKLDSFLVQPKNVLLSCITTDCEPSAFGDLIYAYIVLFIYGCNLKIFLLFTLFVISGGIIITAIAVILASLSFWIGRADMIADTGNSLMISFATYPDSIFKPVVKMLLYTIVPVGLITYMPVSMMINFDYRMFIVLLVLLVVIVSLSFLIFYKGLKRYSSSNLMIAKI